MTGTHGSGIENQASANYVSEFAYVDHEGKSRRLNRKNGAEFKHFLHSFGTLGIIYEMTFDAVDDEYGVTKCIY